MIKHEFNEIRVPIEEDNPSIQRDESKCIRCGKCKEICKSYIGVANRFTLNETNNEAVCIHCGQCAKVCPTKSICEKDERNLVIDALNDIEKIVIFSTSPSVRVGLGEAFGMPKGINVEGKMISLLRNLGADFVFDTTFAADLTIMEEASELIKRIQNKDTLPLFTSCCPAWVKFVETFYPEMIPHLSSVKSPIGMQGPTIKSYFASQKGLNPRQIINVAVTPCVAKKYEIRRNEMNAVGRKYGDPTLRDMDYVITTNELAAWAKEKNINLEALPDGKFDNLLARGSGAGIIFGNSGGVMEAAIRTAYYLLTQKSPPADLLHLTSVRGLDAIKEATVQIQDATLHVAVVYGTKTAADLLKTIQAKEKHYDFIEVMTCPGGCIGGGGQPEDNPQTLAKRIESLYREDETLIIRNSYENPDIQNIYTNYYQKPMSNLAKELLHTFYQDKSEILTRKKGENNMKKFVCPVCGYVHTGDTAPEKCPLCGAAGNTFIEQKEQQVWAAEHVVGVAKGVDEQIVEGLRMNFSGECSEVGMYLAMSRVAIREGYPEIGEFYHRAALEEAEHAAKFAELLGEVVTDSTKKNLEMRIDAENGATLGKVELAKRAKELGLDAIHDTVHEMARDEARHGKGFQGLLNRYFK